MESTQTTKSQADRARLPLDGVRILDLTAVWAGPFGTKLLGDVGAEVIRVEAPGRPDLLRLLSDKSKEDFFQYNPYFGEYNRNKLSVAIDLKEPLGRDAFLRLSRNCDVIVENFRPGVMTRLGLDYSDLRDVNPEIIMVSIPGYSSLGSESSLPAYGPSVEQLSGLTHLNGYRDGPPQKSGISYGDPIGGLFGAIAVLLALIHKKRTGRGQWIEVSQRNALITLIGEAFAAHQWGAPLERMGNRDEQYAPQGCYRCLPNDAAASENPDGTWITLSVTSDAEWLGLTEAMHREDLAERVELLTSEGRQAAHDEIDEAIADWTTRTSISEIITSLHHHDVPHSKVLDVVDVRHDRHLAARGFFVNVPHPIAGLTHLTKPLWGYGSDEREIQHAPAFGQHNRSVLRDVGELDESEIDDLLTQAVIADRPTGF